MDFDGVDVIVEPPGHFERKQLVLRIAIVLALSILGAPVAWGFGALYLLLPLIAAAVISSRGPEGYLATAGDRVLDVIRWWVAFTGYLCFLGDRVPLEMRDYRVRIDLRPSTHATLGGALLRLLISIPVALLLCVLWWAAGFVLLFAAIGVLLGERVPSFCTRFMSFVLRLEVRLLVYQACLSDRHPFVTTSEPRPAY
ncbi:MAG TPA: DUF4389 domain-containing protein [Polyangiaceae bacterium]|nr:DUF4389 domain-containing protein [Polyangiaceae bacterium]